MHLRHAMPEWSFWQRLLIQKTALVWYPDITVLFGNLLENAVETCKQEPEKPKFIKLRVKQLGQFYRIIRAE